MKLQVIFLFLILFSACDSDTEGSRNVKVIDESIHSADSTWEVPVEELTAEQQDALEALNQLQVSSEEQHRLYSTLANMIHVCYPPDTSTTISQADFRMALERFTAAHHTNLLEEVRKNLIQRAALAQKEYRLHICLNEHTTNVSEIPRSGTWIFPGILGHRDLVLVW